MLFSLNYRHNLLELLTLALVQQDPAVSFPEPQFSTLRWVISISILWFTLSSLAVRMYGKYCEDLIANLLIAHWFFCWPSHKLNIFVASVADETDVAMIR
jgi:hypothetical protein